MNRIFTIKRDLDTQTIGQPLTIYRNSSDGNDELDGVSCCIACSLKPGEERSFDVGSAEVELFAVLEEDGNRRIVGRYVVDNCLNYTKLHVRRNRKDDTSEFVFSEHETRPPIISKKFMGPICGVLIVTFILFWITVYYFGDDIYFHFIKTSKAPKEFTTDEFSITLSKAFERDFQNKDYYAVYYSPDPCLVFIEEDRFEEMPELEDMTLREYCKLLMKVNNDSNFSIIDKDGMLYYVGNTTYNNYKCIFYTFVYKTEDAFWFVHFLSTEERSDYWDDCYLEWAKSMQFK